MSLNIVHPYGDLNGFFSNCSVRLENIINYYNCNKKMPIEVDSSKLFFMYKKEKNKDVTFDYFKNYNFTKININIDHLLKYDGGILHMQYKNYLKIDFVNICPFIKKYFEPTEHIINIKNTLLQKYNIDPDNCIAVYYRGTDKFKEVNICDFYDFEQKVKEILNNSSAKLKILLVTDSKQMLNNFKSKFTNILFIEENKISETSNGIHNENSSSENHYDIMYLMATFLILAKCNFFVCGSNNGALWTMFYRENNINVYQNFNGKWIN